MSLLFESIKVVNKKLQLISFHNERLNRSRHALFGCKDELNLANLIDIPTDITNEVYKCKVIYSDKIKDVEFRKYNTRNIEKLNLVNDDEIDYSYKYLDRSVLDDLVSKHCKDNGDDILIIKNGRITDTSYSNIALFNGKEWHTPKFPLLRGTKRAKLLYDKRIIEKDIMVYDLQNYEQIILINSMLEFDTREAKLIGEILTKLNIG
jgi:4-amino-4-deoxychorismate lyase